MRKKTKNIRQKLIFSVNIFSSLLLIIEYLLPFVDPDLFGVIPIFTLLTPLVIFINLFFVFYWLFKLNIRFIASLVALLIGVSYVTLFFQTAVSDFSDDHLKIMSYNVRYLNVNGWSKEKNTAQKIQTFIRKENPDILAMQEYAIVPDITWEEPYQFFYKTGDIGGVAIFSKYPFLDKGKLTFENSHNGAIFADIVLKTDTIRVYNIHLESFAIKNLKKIKTNFAKISSGFQKQSKEVKMILSHSEKSPYRCIFMGDFNNTEFSWVYRQLKKNKIDCAEGFSKWLGATYRFPTPLLRIDFILADKRLKNVGYKKFEVTHSDHFPIMAWLSMKQ